MRASMHVTWKVNSDADENEISVVCPTDDQLQIMFTILSAFNCIVYDIPSYWGATVNPPACVFQSP